jgi:dihydroorotate dehydrogenase subfamily 2
VAVFGILQYLVVIGLSLALFCYWRKWLSWWLLLQSLAGFLFSLYFMGLQVFVIHAICLYCCFSAFLCTSIFGLCWGSINTKREFILKILAVFYQPLKKIFFLFPPERIHVVMVHLGELLGKSDFLKRIFRSVFVQSFPRLEQDLAGLHFASPFGLAAGFDYEARLTQILPSLGFGFQTVGTITNIPCQGNPQPRLGRLPKSKALLVNKGFRNPGSHAISKKLRPLRFAGLVGISVGQTNTPQLKTRPAVLKDILATFQHFERSRVAHHYYELNISCPNLATNISFYQPAQLDQLLTRIDRLKLNKPVFIKMPINEPDQQFLALLRVITKHSIAGIIVGNLQKNRQDPSVSSNEIKTAGPGNLSGKPTFKLSNHLISLAYQYFHQRLIIIGCGGVFSAQDALQKIELGASAVQLITGLIFEGPQLTAQMNLELNQLLKVRGYATIKDAVGAKVKRSH